MGLKIPWKEFVCFIYHETEALALRTPHFMNWGLKVRCRLQIHPEKGEESKSLQSDAVFPALHLTHAVRRNKGHSGEKDKVFSS